MTDQVTFRVFCDACQQWHHDPDAVRTVIKHNPRHKVADLSAWASTIPWPPGVYGVNFEGPVVGDVCPVVDCGHIFRDDEEVYRVTQREGYVCWQHVHPDRGPVISRG